MKMQQKMVKPLQLKSDKNLIDRQLCACRDLKCVHTPKKKTLIYGKIMAIQVEDVKESWLMRAYTHKNNYTTSYLYIRINILQQPIMQERDFVGIEKCKSLGIDPQ